MSPKEVTKAQTTMPRADLREVIRRPPAVSKQKARSRMQRVLSATHRTISQHITLTDEETLRQKILLDNMITKYQKGRARPQSSTHMT